MFCLFYLHKNGKNLLYILLKKKLNPSKGQGMGKRHYITDSLLLFLLKFHNGFPVTNLNFKKLFSKSLQHNNQFLIRDDNYNTYFVIVNTYSFLFFLFHLCHSTQEPLSQNIFT